MERIQEGESMTLKELCEKARISAPLMKKFQMKFGLGTGEFTGRSTRRSYPAHQAFRYIKVAWLRRAGLSYEEIKVVLQRDDWAVELALSQTRITITELQTLKKILIEEKRNNDQFRRIARKYRE
jgi:DNA-binding transcriptional MerR regulator